MSRVLRLGGKPPGLLVIAAVAAHQRQIIAPRWAAKPDWRQQAGSPTAACCTGDPPNYAGQPAPGAASHSSGNAHGSTHLRVARAGRRAPRGRSPASFPPIAHQVTGSAACTEMLQGQWNAVLQQPGQAPSRRYASKRANDSMGARHSGHSGACSGSPNELLVQ